MESNTIDSTLSFSWRTRLDERVTLEIIGMLQDSINDAAILGFSEKTGQDEYIGFLKELNRSLVNNSVYLLEIRNMVEDEIAGMTILVPNKTTNCKHIVDITKGFIRSKYRGRQGVSGAFNAIARKCRSEGHDLLTLDVREGSRAHKLWSSFGFQQYGRLERYSIYNNEVYPGVYLQQSLNDLEHTLGGL